MGEIKDQREQGLQLQQVAKHLTFELLRRIEGRLRFKPEDISEDSFIFAYEIPCPCTGYFTPIVSSWLLLENEENKKYWFAVPSIDKDAGKWDAKIIQSSSKQNIPAPTFFDDKFRSIFTEEIYGQEWIESQILRGDISDKLIAVAYHGQNALLAFREPTKEDIDDFHLFENALVKEIYLNDNQVFLNSVQPLLDNKLLTPKQKLIFFVTLDEVTKLFKEIKENGGINAPSTLFDIIIDGVREFLVDNVGLFEWDPICGVAVRQQKNIPFLKNFPLLTELSIEKNYQCLKNSIALKLQYYQDLFDVIGLQSLESTIVLNYEKNLELEVEEKSASAIIVDIEDILQWEQLDGRANRQARNLSNFLEDHVIEGNRQDSEVLRFITKDMFVKVIAPGQNGTIEKLDRETRKKKMAKTFMEIGKYLKDEGFLFVICDDRSGDLVDDVQDGLEKVGLKVVDTKPIVGTSFYQAVDSVSKENDRKIILVATK